MKAKSNPRGDLRALTQLGSPASTKPGWNVSSSFRHSAELILISLLLLFLELACIRWFPAHVLFLTFFTNMVLLACFLGMSVGCLAAKHRRNYLVWTPLLLAIAMGAGLTVESLRTTFRPVLDGQVSPQVVFFGTEDNNSPSPLPLPRAERGRGEGEVDRFLIPMEVLAGSFFLLIALAMVGPGQELGRAFNRHPNRVLAYTLNILGSCAGVILFAVCAWLELPPLAWFLPVALGCGWFLLVGGTGAMTTSQIPNPKFEIRNKFKARNLKSQTKRKMRFRELAFGISDLFRISDFGFRILNPLAPLVAVLVLASWTTGSYSQRPQDQSLPLTALPEGISEAEVESCLVKVGAEVKPGQQLITVRTGRTAFSIFASCSGKIQSLRQPGEKITAGGWLLTVLPVGLGEHLWSPYYRIDFDPAPRLFISVNLIGHQTMVSRQTSFAPAYALPYLLHRDAHKNEDRAWKIEDRQKTPLPFRSSILDPQSSILASGGGVSGFEDVLVIGAGSGNDVSRALQWGAKHVDAVEIDPLICRLGKDHHPDQPYQDDRVTIHLDDGRNFLCVTNRRYDLIVYALVDSLVLHSGYSNIRLESYLFTSQAFADVRRRLKPGGLFVMYNAFRQGWIVSRLSRGLEEAFETAPLILTYPCRETLHPDESFSGMTMLIAGESASLAPLREAFRAHPNYWLRNDQVPGPASPNGFEHIPTSLDLDHWQRFQLATVYQPEEPLRMAGDDWPFLYLRRPMIPDLSWRGAAIMGGLALLLIYLFSRKGSPNPKLQLAVSSLTLRVGMQPTPTRSVSEALGETRTKHGNTFLFNFIPGRSLGYRMFFLGAGFMLIETKAVVHMALLFGSTWVVAAVVFLAVLIMILTANLFVLRFRPQRLSLPYAGLLATLILSLLIPLDSLLGLPRGLQECLACLLVFGPIFFAGVIFAVSLERSSEPSRALGVNIAGAMAGGLAEYLSMLLGFHGLVCVAIAFYVLSAVRVQSLV